MAEQGALAARLLLDLLDGTLEGDVDVDRADPARRQGQHRGAVRPRR